MVTVSLGPSTTVTIGAGTMTNPLIDGSTSTTTSLFTTASPGVPSAIVSTITLVTEIGTTVFPSITPSPSSLFTSLSSDSITTASTTPTTILSSALPTTSSATSSTASSGPSPVPTPTDSDFNPITAPAIGGGNSILAQNAADAQALNRKFRQLTFRDNCVNGDQACIGDSRAFCTLGTWRSDLCMRPNTKCRAVPRMQTNGTVLGLLHRG
ncbi:hypothetical protein OPQ81_008277 [Rhizoctonia solani]|nr:hypothetical protein OPQ81_008277 [Rhizoctonia solani]